MEAEVGFFVVFIRLGDPSSFSRRTQGVIEVLGSLILKQGLQYPFLTSHFDIGIYLVVGICRRYSAQRADVVFGICWIPVCAGMVTLKRAEGLMLIVHRLSNRNIIKVKTTLRR
jgi:hypothetical protein